MDHGWNGIKSYYGTSKVTAITIMGTNGCIMRERDEMTCSSDLSSFILLAERSLVKLSGGKTGTFVSIENSNT
jgi:hypothetical protein